MAAYRVMVKGGRLLLAEVRLFPDHRSDSQGPGQWSEEASEVPAEGVPGRALRALRLETPLARFPRLLQMLRRNPTFARQLHKTHGIPVGAEMARRRPGRAGRPDSFYLPWAVAYVERLAAGSRRPTKDLAANPPAVVKGFVSDGRIASEATVRDLIHQARVRGLLTASPIGRPGGELTTIAQQMLKPPRNGGPGGR